MGYVNYSFYLPNTEILRRIKAAAKDQGLTVSSFIRLAAEKAVAAHEKKRAKAA